MKQLIFAFILFSARAFAAEVPPTDAQLAAMQVRQLVELARTKDAESIVKLISKNTDPKARHTAKAQNVIRLLGDVKLADIQHTPARVIIEKNIVSIRITAPINLDLDFERITAGGATTLLLKSIHP